MSEATRILISPSQVQDRSDSATGGGEAVKIHFSEANPSPPHVYRPILAIVGASALLGLLLCSCSSVWSCLLPVQAGVTAYKSASRNTMYALASVMPLLEVFQVYPPVVSTGVTGVAQDPENTPSGSSTPENEQHSQCQQILVVHSFGFSYGQPFVGFFTPPSCEYNRVTWNLSVRSSGRQFDRLGTVFLGDIEVFRTSTAEPTATGIQWTYLKDMTPYLSLFGHSQKLIFDLGNLVDDIYTGAFNVTLTAAYFNLPDSAKAADVILPISARRSATNSSSVFTIPSEIATNNLTIPQTTTRAVFTVAATGQSEEEFWWSNVLSSDIETFPQTGPLYGYSPFREIQLYIDDMLAGVAWPYPVVFTGGIVPGLWRPIVGIDAFDLREDEIDITPWLTLLCDGLSHVFTVKVTGLSGDHNGTAKLSDTVGNYWVVTGKVFLWFDEANQTTTGTNLVRSVPSPSLITTSSIIGSPDGSNGTLEYHVDAHRVLAISTTLQTSNGFKEATWRQSLSFSNFGALSAGGTIQVNQQSTRGSDLSSNGWYAKRFYYPLWVHSSYGIMQEKYIITADIKTGKDVEVLGSPVFPSGLDPFLNPHNGQLSFSGAALSTTQNGSATYIANSTSSTSFSFGTTEQDMVFSGITFQGPNDTRDLPSNLSSTELFHRHVIAANGTVLDDHEQVLDMVGPHRHLELDGRCDFAAPGVNAMLGRGPAGSGKTW